MTTAAEDSLTTTAHQLRAVDAARCGATTGRHLKR